ncbi:hypothetical protein J7L05_09460 [bacterium]|nr:hypothetical protein [bacterium]
MGKLDKMIKYFHILISVLLVCCTCLACGEKSLPPPPQSQENRIPERFKVPDPISVHPVISTLRKGGSSNEGPVERSNVPMLVNPDFTVEELPLGVIKFKKERLRVDNLIKEQRKKMGRKPSGIPEQMVNRAERKTETLPDQGKSIVWLSSYAIYAMQLDSCELWANYSPYQNWSVESFCLAEAEYPKALLGVSMSYLFPYNRILEIDMATGGINGFYELPENLGGVYVLNSLGNNRYFAVSYQGDDSWRLSLLNLGDKPFVEKAIIFKKFGLPSSRGYNAFNGNGTLFYFNNRGFFITVDIEKLEIVKKQEMKKPVKQIAFLPDRNEFCALSSKTLTLLDPQTFKVLNSFEFPMQPALRDDIDRKSGQVYLKKGEPTYLTPSGITYRNKTNELIVTFDYSPKMLLIDCETKEQRFVEFAEESITLGQPVYLDEEHLLIGGKHIYNFKTGSGKLIAGGENSLLLDSLFYF